MIDHLDHLVLTTAREAADRGYQVTLVEEEFFQ